MENLFDRYCLEREYIICWRLWRASLWEDSQSPKDQYDFNRKSCRWYWECPCWVRWRLTFSIDQVWKKMIIVDLRRRCSSFNKWNGSIIFIKSFLNGKVHSNKFIEQFWLKKLIQKIYVLVHVSFWISYVSTCLLHSFYKFFN